MLALALALALCAPGARPTPAPPGAAPALQVARAVPPYGPGERMDFAIHYLGAKMGMARISVDERDGPVLPVQLQARTGGLMKLFDVRQQLVSSFDTESLLPRAFSLDAVELGYRHADTTRFDRAAGKATVRSRGKYDNTNEIDVPPETTDFVGLVFRLRTEPLADGYKHAFPVLAGTRVNTIVAEVVAREKVETDAGEFPAVKVRVPTGFTGKFSEKNPTFIWFSDDARRVVVRISTDFAIGRAVAELVGYQPGRAHLDE